MNEDYYPLITLIFLLPLFFSPYTIEGLFAEEMQDHAIIQFEYPRSLTDLRSDIQTQLEPELSQFYDDNDSTTSLSSISLTEADNHIIYFLDYQEGTQNNIYQVSVQDVLTIEENVDVQFNNDWNVPVIKNQEGNNQ